MKEFLLNYNVAKIVLFLLLVSSLDKALAMGFSCGVNVDEHCLEYDVPASELSKELGKKLVAACSRNNVEEVGLLLAEGADPNYNVEGNIPLFSTESPAIIVLLVQHGANPNITPIKDDDYPPLIKLARQGARLSIPMSAYQILLDAGADPNISLENCDNLTALDYAVHFQNFAGVCALLAGGANPHKMQLRDLDSFFSTFDESPIKIAIVRRLLRARLYDYEPMDKGSNFEKVYDALPLTKMLLQNHAVNSGEECESLFCELLETYKKTYFSISEDQQKKVKQDLAESCVISCTRGYYESDLLIQTIFYCGLDVKKLLLAALAHSAITGNIRTVIRVQTLMGDTSLGLIPCTSDELQELLRLATLNGHTDLVKSLVRSGALLSKALRLIDNPHWSCKADGNRQLYRQIRNAHSANESVEHELHNPLSRFSLLAHDMVRLFLQRFVASAAFN